MIKFIPVFLACLFLNLAAHAQRELPEIYVEGGVGGQFTSLDEDYYFMDQYDSPYSFEKDAVQGSVGGGVNFDVAPAIDIGGSAYYEFNNSEQLVYEDPNEVEYIEFNNGYGARANAAWTLPNAETSIGAFVGVGQTEICKNKTYDYGNPGFIESCADVNFVECGLELGHEFGSNDAFELFGRVAYRDYEDFDTSFEPDFQERHEFSGNSTVAQIGMKFKFGRMDMLG
ncbi:MAG: hypothetical protein CMK09_18360 [Ponticaulis sp.]|nr:hypothetical protein [Ponticaulis sp.]|tara:strand:- start:41635 stop:42318 length:684 start_codon:yes stop_codon:yes gene_type:complete